MKNIKLVFAFGSHYKNKTLNVAFGNKQGLPWAHCRKDLMEFKKSTLDTMMIMGAKTFASLPSLLPDREHIVVCDTTRDEPLAKNGDSATVYVSTLAEAIAYSGDKSCSIIGGPSLLYEAAKIADTLVITEFAKNPDSINDNNDCVFEHDVSINLNFVYDWVRDTKMGSDKNLIETQDDGTNVVKYTFKKLD